MTTKQTLDKVVGEKMNAACATCAGETRHEVMKSVDVDFEDVSEDYRYYSNASFQIVQCLGCEQLSFRKVSSNSEDYYSDDRGDCHSIEHEELFPNRLLGRKGIEEDQQYLPDTVRSVYTETLRAISGNSPILTGIGIRALIEAICKDQEAVGKNLYEKLGDLKAKGVLTLHGERILHEIRALGNGAAHEAAPHRIDALVLAMDVVEGVLKEIYVFPAKAKRAFKAGAHR